MAKTNQRSIRFTDEVAEIVNKMEGNGFNEKFENLCIDYNSTIPEREKMKKYLDRVITTKKEQIKELDIAISKYKNLKDSFGKLSYQLDMVSDTTNNILNTYENSKKQNIKKDKEIQNIQMDGYEMYHICKKCDEKTDHEELKQNKGYCNNCYEV